MPQILYEIGDRIWSPAFGFGYIAGPPKQYIHDGNNHTQTHTICYLAYFHEKYPFAAYVTEPVLEQTATPDSIRLVQDNIMDVFLHTRPDQKSYDYNTGDIINHQQFGKGLILSGCDICPGLHVHNIYHHVYYFQTKQFRFECIDNMSLQIRATDSTKKQAVELVRDNIYLPIFSAGQPIDTTRPVDTTLLQLMETKIQINI